MFGLLLATGGAGGLTPLAIARPAAGAGEPSDPAAGAQISQPPLHVIPFPNTPDAAAQSEIIFSALRPSELRAPPIVTGSSSGVHGGHLIRLPDRAGTAFVPRHPFSPGETVTVDALLTSPQAGTASGNPGGMSLNWQFTIAIPAPAPGGRTTATTRRTAASSGVSPFRSQPQLDPPPVHVTTGPAPGERPVFLTPRVADSHSPFQSGLMIRNRRGQLVWFRPVSPREAFNLEVQRYRGQPVLTWWQGFWRHGRTTDGQDVILSRAYKPLAVLHAAYGYSSDLHEFQLTRQGTALIDAYVPVRVNLTRVGGPANGWLNDCIIQELDIRTGRILWEWHALGHVPLSAARSPRLDGHMYAYFHMNAIQQLSGHRLLVSARDAWSAYLINQRTGRLIWTLGGKYSSFKMGPGTNFEWQHDVHLNGHHLVTLFDDGSAPQEEPQSSAKELRIDPHTRRVSLVHRYTHSPPLLASVGGSAELLPNHDLVVGWGNTPDFSQLAPSGRQLFNATFPIGVTTYRAYRFGWKGQPLSRPSLARSGSAKGITWLYASWNGATQVAAWRVLGGSRSGKLKPLKTKPWRGFETAIRLRAAPRFVSVEALGRHGNVLGRSRVRAGH